MNNPQRQRGRVASALKLEFEAAVEIAAVHRHDVDDVNEKGASRQPREGAETLATLLHCNRPGNVIGRP